MKYKIFANLLGLICDFEIEIIVRNVNLVEQAIGMTNTKIEAIKMLRTLWPDFLGLREAKDMIDDAWNKTGSWR